MKPTPDPQDSAAVHPDFQVGPDVPNPGGLHVLLVEDDAETAATMARLVRRGGHKVQVALDGLAALESARKGLPDVVLLDLNLPGLDGYGVARWIGAQPYDKRPLLIAVTGLAQDADRQRSAEAGIDLHLVKPVVPEHLLWLLSRFRAIIS